MGVRILTGDCLEMLKTLPAESVHCVVTSPPYWGLRDYGHADQIGLEPTPALYVERLTEVFREVRRVSRKDATLWLNLGDSYSGSGKGGNPDEGKQATNRGSQSIGVLYGKTGDTAREATLTNVSRIWTTQEGIPPKNLIGIPWRVAFALQADGWYLRQDIIWSKPNPMPESVRDRCTKAHEYLFLLSKSERYFYDCDAIQEPRSQDEDSSTFRGGCYVSGEIDNGQMGKRRVPGNKSHKHTAAYEAGDDLQRTKAGLVAFAERERAADPTDFGTRNKRSVWTIATAPFKEAHFATFPPALIEPCILAGCPVGGTVLDPFFGSGTTGEVAERLGRNCIGIELNPEYVKLAERRCAQLGMALV